VSLARLLWDATPRHRPAYLPKTTLRRLIGVAEPHPTSALLVRAQLLAVHVPAGVPPPRAVL